MSEALERQLALARHFRAIDQHARVLETLRRAEEGALASAEYWELRAGALYELDRHQDAASATAKGLELEPESLELLRLRTESLARLGRLAEAERAILAALRQDPEQPELLCSYARLLARGHQVDKASRLVAEAARLVPDHPRVIATRLLLAHLRGEDGRAAEHGRELLSEAPDQAGSHYLMGFSLEQAGRSEEAARHFETAAELEPADHAYAESARRSRLVQHPLLIPLRPLQWLSPAGLWLLIVVTMSALYLAHAYRALLAVALVYLALCVYSWVVPPALRYWLKRRGR